MEEDKASKLSEQISKSQSDNLKSASQVPSTANDDVLAGGSTKSLSTANNKVLAGGSTKAPSVQISAVKEKTTDLGSKEISVQPSGVTCTTIERLRTKRVRKVKDNKCPQKWECEDEALWRVYMQLYTEETKKKLDERDEWVPKRRRKREEPRRLLEAPMSMTPYCQKMNAFNCQRGRPLGTNGVTFTSIWESMMNPKMYKEPSLTSLTDSDMEWPNQWPCLKRDVIRERKILMRKAKMKNSGATACEIDEVDSPGTSDDDKLQELANQKELGHARIPLTCPKKRDIILVDRAAGENPGLVNGDYYFIELCSKTGGRIYANVCLRGLLGMPIAELMRCREKTWKFCLFQALVALLAKTQIRYRYAWGANIDYIYEHAWMLFLHIGFINAKNNQRFNDVLVYNYKYSVELQLVHELKDIPVVKGVSFKYVEKALHRQRMKPRKELTVVKSAFGTQKTKDSFKLSVHKGTKIIEKWFDELEDCYSNCIFKTTRFSLAFWRDGSFWYLYNPYRCDKFGLWQDNGAACITKFCTKDSLRRHLMILTLRAYACDLKHAQDDDDGKNTVGEPVESKGCIENKTFSIQIYQIIYHSCKIHNVKLYLRTPSKSKPVVVEKKKSDPCTFDPLAHLAPMPCDGSIQSTESQRLEEIEGKMEKTYWLQKPELPWSKLIREKKEKKECAEGDEEDDEEDPMWHSFEVIEDHRLYVLWGKNHIRDRIFAEENRGKQSDCCYAVCAGMTMINVPEYWSGESLDAIVISGDRFYTQRKSRSELPQNPCNPHETYGVDDWDDQPYDHFRIGDTLFELRALPAIEGRLYVSTSQCLWRTLESFFQKQRFGILSCENARLAVFKHCGAYYIYDVRSYGPPIYEKGQSATYLLRVPCFIDFVKNLVLIIGSPECSKFKLRPLEIGNIVDVANDGCRKRKVCKEETDEGKKVDEDVCPLDEEKKKKNKKKKGKRPSLDKDKKEKKRTVCH